MSDLLGGRLGVEAYARYTEQLWFVYAALEAPAGRLAPDPVAGPFVRAELMRLPSLERDLEHLRGPGWRTGLSALPATEAYAARVRECAERWPAGYVAHHYTRYLGDLSGGQIIRDRAERAWGFAKKGDGVRFYVFEEITNPAAFKREYRELLDGIRADDLEKQRIVAECRRAFALNTAVFRSLGEEFSLSA
jgi:heme oxygenase